MPIFNRLQRISTKATLPPELYTTGETALGESYARGRQVQVCLPDSVRDRHVYIVGKTRSGKSTLLLNIALQDIERGQGVAVIDPHGDLVEDLLHCIPATRAKDTIYFNAADKERPIALNILNAQSDEEIGLLADDLMVTFRRLSESWGERMETILRYTFHTLLRVPGSTFVDIQRLLQNQNFRERAVRAAGVPLLADFWGQQFPQLPKDAAQPILNRMSKFVLSPTLYSMLSQTGSTLDFYEMIQGRQVLLVNLASGKIGEDNARLLGSLIVSQLQLAIMRRANLPKAQRHPYYLFVDEFQNFTTSAFEKILSEAGKYRLSLTLSHQYISQIQESLRYAILGNVGTLIMFPLGQHDAMALRSELGSYEPSDLSNLSVQNYEALCRPATQSRDTFKFSTLAPPEPTQQDFSEVIIEQSRRIYGRRPSIESAKNLLAVRHSTEPTLPPPQDAGLMEQEVSIASPAPSVISSLPPHQAKPEPRAKAAKLHKTKPSMVAGPEQVTPVTPVVLSQVQTGRGGQQHKYLQQLIKRLAEDKGFRVVIEQSVLGGAGFVDVSLERGERKIACEISVTSTETYELGNIQKCLAAGYDQVIILSAEKRALQKLERSAASHLEAESLDRVLFLQPESFVSFLEEMGGDEAGKEEMVQGYKVKVRYKAVDASERKARQQAIAQVILGALKRMKDNNEE